MEPFIRKSGIIAALPSANIDTDVIMPKTFLKGIDRSGLKKGVFHDFRFDADGSPRPGFVLNKAPWNKAEFLVTGANFGCGSSREHAVWGLRQIGISAIIAPSFAGIFYDNCAKNGLLAITLPADKTAALVETARKGKPVTIDLLARVITAPDFSFDFDIPERRRQMLLSGLDAIGATLEMRRDIEAFQARYLEERPWLAWSER
ncbi:MAG: 3-isopropylmalate dehydratase small subunit [Alphaproteobacteria bacterium]|nr:MAG: 3-isopropylmalate dehydratase small subunit [Alphaproteobacteria bacterium]